MDGRARLSDLRELERQMERGSLFAHTALGEQADRAEETEAIVNGLVDLLVRGGVVSQEDLLAAVEAARTEGGAAAPRVALRVDGQPAPVAEVDCARRLPVCGAVCCRLRFALTAEEVERGPMKWDLGRPYLNRQDEDGCCHRFDRESQGCGIYDERPPVCREYSCANDPRIWKDFEAVELNHDYIEAHLGADRPRLVEMLIGRAPDL